MSKGNVPCRQNYAGPTSRLNIPTPVTPLESKRTELERLRKEYKQIMKVLARYLHEYDYSGDDHSEDDSYENGMAWLVGLRGTPHRPPRPRTVIG
ncbi:hypothetical protein HanRHA438_Chr11g0519621 [Helianthus annuus]|uniref:Uncharacterized protein n=1 Tax=Helianthus annuus TaxID=4232 RepID=A0A9K3HRE9_HELAN|nr:hypothetical protein HanXRQr2_Chr11g0507061 [Helianthus annuus]KAJ0502691.1 hypothetical protein HanHA300_Chr11g0415801 [Helianthus annuus]KAJ0518656.1 hypothetical protein HanHA89_Chr11g0439891 [Helianthus annuus]KAJ0686698.1 hypothetical protein HanLR1_Chr11g0417651 [Helianthus annuus]KAJ0690502.1 hypothetical protein HanOQP8_Chr11g0418541 [Helianthus annuus]